MIWQRNGLSPLARGTLLSALPRLELRRFIPARAGNTPLKHRPALQFSVYPRSRGEHLRRTLRGKHGSGLSPLARGTHCVAGASAAEVRFIPARAGNTYYAEKTAGELAVYPRSRGEHSDRLPATDCSRGLSPLARGTHRMRLRDLDETRFIPARAGNTLSWTFLKSALTVYPRSRGEHRESPQNKCSASGLSPLARGTRSAQALRWSRCRFIPARAGNTYLLVCGNGRLAVYPRSRGEH